MTCILKREVATGFRNPTLFFKGEIWATATLVPHAFSSAGGLLLTQGSAEPFCYDLL